MKYVVGQIVYVVLKKENKVIPVQVIEEITKKTLKGEEVTYMIRSNAGEPMLISQVAGEVFATSEEARTVLTQRAINAINSLVNAAVQKAREWFPTGIEKPAGTEPNVSELIGTHDGGDDESMFVELPDGSKARVKQIKVADALKS